MLFLLSKFEMNSFPIYQYFIAGHDLYKINLLKIFTLLEDANHLL